MHVEDSMVMYGIYNAETSEKLINMLHHLHNITTPNEKYLQDNLMQHRCGTLINTVLRIYNNML